MTPGHNSNKLTIRWYIVMVLFYIPPVHFYIITALYTECCERAILIQCHVPLAMYQIYLAYHLTYSRYCIVQIVDWHAYATVTAWHIAADMLHVSSSISTGPLPYMYRSNTMCMYYGYMYHRAVNISHGTMELCHTVLWNYVTWYRGIMSQLPTTIP